MGTSTDDNFFTLGDPADALVREVFARFGRAFYASNCLEREIAGTLMHVEWRSNLRPPMTRDQFHESYDLFYAGLQATPMGGLVSRLKKVPDLPQDLRDALDECLKERNLLAHHYFWERAGEFGIPDGQRTMIDECDSMLRLFEETDAKIREYVKPYLERHGVTDEALEKEQRRLLEDATNKLARPNQ